MFVAYVVLGSSLVLILLFSAFGKLTRQKQLVDQMHTLRVSPRIVPLLGVAQVAGALGLTLGLSVHWLGVLAAACITLYFLGAVGAHLRVHDYKGTLPAAVLAACSAALIVLGASL